MGETTRWFVSRDTKLYEVVTHYGKGVRCINCAFKITGDSGDLCLFVDGCDAMDILAKDIYFKEITNG